MWTTLDDLTLSIAPAALRRLAVRHRTSGLTDLVRRSYRASLLPAVRRAVGQLARVAYLTGNIRSRSGQRYPTFTARVRGRSYMLVTRPLGRNRYTIVAVRPAPNSESEDGPGAAIANAWLLQMLRSQVADPAVAIHAIRSGQAQVNLTGDRIDSNNLNKPDKSYVDTSDRRVNIEIDTNPGESARHSGLVNRDAGALNYYLIAHHDTGQIIGGRVRVPGQAERPLRPDELQAIIAGRGLPRPRAQADPGRRRRPPRMTPQMIRDYGIIVPAAPPVQLPLPGILQAQPVGRPARGQQRPPVSRPRPQPARAASIAARARRVNRRPSRRPYREFEGELAALEREIYDE